MNPLPPPEGETCCSFSHLYLTTPVELCRLLFTRFRPRDGRKVKEVEGMSKGWKLITMKLNYVRLKLRKNILVLLSLQPKTNFRSCRTLYITNSPRGK